MLTFDQKQIVLGTLLGAGFMCNHDRPYLCVQHRVRDKEYLFRKVENLLDLGRKTAFYQRGNVVGWRAKTLDCWESFYETCYYHKKKKVSMEWLDQLHAIGLAVWFCDSGTFTGHKKQNAMLRTAGFHDDNKTIESYFREVGLPCAANVTRRSYNIVFSVKGTQKLMEIVAPYVPECVSRRWL